MANVCQPTAGFTSACMQTVQGPAGIQRFKHILDVRVQL